MLSIVRRMTVWNFNIYPVHTAVRLISVGINAAVVKYLEDQCSIAIHRQPMLHILIVVSPVK